MLLIFLSLSLIIFSLLSLSGAVADETLSSQAAERTTEYYAAVSSANTLLAKIDEQLAAYLRESDSSGTVQKSDKTDGQASGQKEAAYLQLCSGIGEEIPGVAWENGKDGGTLSFSVDVDDEQLLQVQLELSYPASDDDTLYRIQTWKVVNTGDWNADNSMNLFRSEDLH